MNEDLDIIIERRNNRLKLFWDSLDFDIRIIGDKNKPVIILDNQKILSCYVHNFDLIFLTKHDGDEVFRLKLTAIVPDITDTDFWYWLNKCNHNRCYSIGVVNSNLRLCGYNFREVNGVPVKYPVFSEYDFKLYFNKKKAENIINWFNNGTLKLELI